MVLMYFKKPIYMYINVIGTYSIFALWKIHESVQKLYKDCHKYKTEEVCSCSPKTDYKRRNNK